MLLSIPVTDPGTIMMICDDTLGGMLALDPRKFGEEFLRRRRQDHFDQLQGGGASSSAAKAPAGLPKPTPLEAFATPGANKFVMVGGKGRKGRKGGK